MSTYRHRPILAEAHQWHKNGDHPEDGSRPLTATDGTMFLAEGRVVRRFRHPHFAGDARCDKCCIVWHNHGWIDDGGEGQTVCPGDWVISDALGVGYHAMKPDLFDMTYEQVAG